MVRWWIGGIEMFCPLSVWMVFLNEAELVNLIIPDAVGGKVSPKR